MFKRWRVFLIFAGIILGVSATSLVLAAFAFSNPDVLAAKLDLQAESQTGPLQIGFAPGSSPWYADEAIFIKPEFPVPGSPLEICAEVVNLDPIDPREAILHFGVAPLGISGPYERVGSTDVAVPPGGEAFGCVNWVPPAGGAWGFEVLLWEIGVPEPIRRLKNIDLWEPLQPGVPYDHIFPLGPLPAEGTITFTLSNILPGWDVSVIPSEIHSSTPGETLTFTLQTVPPADMPLGTRLPIVDVEGFLNGETIGGIRKLDNPPVPLHRPREPFFAESEIHVWPYPPRAGEPTQLCVDLFNFSSEPVPVEVLFNWANFGIGLPFTPINGPIPDVVPPGGHKTVCINWVPPVGGHFCIQVELVIPGDIPYHLQFSQRNLDVAEPLRPGVPHAIEFMVGNYHNSFTNPEPNTADIWLETDVLIPGWQVEIVPDILLAVPPGEGRPVVMTVTAPADLPLPPDNTPILDVRALVDDLVAPRVIGGLRKVFRPPIPLHPFPDPPYAEREITVHPYPPLAGEPTEVCVELRNPTSVPQDVVVQFAWANFGIGIPFTPINGPRPVHLPPHSLITECIWWVPPVSGNLCLEVMLEMEGYEPQRSQRNIDIDEPLQPGVPHQLTFPVGNPLEHPITVTLGSIPHVDGWGIELMTDTLPNLMPGQEQDVTLVVQPPADLPLPPDSTIIADVEAFAEGELLGGFRKIHRPPVPLHPFPDPPYAEREITVHPYPPLAGEPTEVCVELRNPTAHPQDVVVNFAWANFGIGIPFTPINGPRPVHLPPHSLITECIWWVPPVNGKVCLEVTLEMEGYEPQRSQRNIDVDEPLQPGVPHQLRFPVGNPFDHPITVTLGTIPHLDGWSINLLTDTIPALPPGETTEIDLVVQPPAGIPLPPDDTVIADVEAFTDGELLGGFRKIHRPPVPLHPFPDPPYAEREITVHPDPPLKGHPTEICVELRNPTAFPQDVVVNFAWANFGIGIPFTPINGPRPVHLPPYSIVKECIWWVPPVQGKVCLEVTLEMEGYADQRSQRNIDVDEPLQPGVMDSLVFPVGNPLDHPVTLTLGIVPHLPNWGIELLTDTIPNLEPGGIRTAELRVTPPDAEPLPPDGEPVVDVEVFADGELIGGFRKVFRPPVPIHRPKDPIYAESEIHIHPYPPRAREPTEIGVEIRNPTASPQQINLTFSYANFGIGLPFTPIDGPITVMVPPFGTVIPSIIWIPPQGGLWCIQVDLEIPAIEGSIYSQRNIDVGEPLEPLVPHARIFEVGNPTSETVTITLGLVPHFPDWGLELDSDTLLSMAPGEVRDVTLTVTPPQDLPADGDPIVDVQAFIEGRLIGGFRKIFRPPVPVHIPKDPVYAESEIGVDPYPVIPGDPTQLSVEVFNPTDSDRIVTATFSIAPFGIGLPFSTDHIMPNPIQIFVPANGAARGHVIWTPPDWRGKFCVQVTLEMEGHDPVWSQRNIDVGEPLEPGVPHSLEFPVGIGEYTEPMTVTMGLVRHKPDWGIRLSETIFPNVQPGSTVTVTLTVTPTVGGPPLGSGEPIADVEAFVDGELLGGFRKMDIPPIPIHKPHEKGYAESEISIDPYPPQQGLTTTVSTVVQNTSDEAVTVELEFGWAKFGMGIPFTTTGMSPYTRTITLSPEMTRAVSIDWVPELSGSHCVIVHLTDPEGVYEPQHSQRNVDVLEQPPCGQELVYTFTVYNDSPIIQTVDLGVITFNVPADWQVTTIPSDTLVLDPYSQGTVEVHVTIPCPGRLSAVFPDDVVTRIQIQAGSIPLIDVEGYIKGELVGGIELRFPLRIPSKDNLLYFPIIAK